MSACNGLVAEGVRGEKLHELANAHVKRAAEDMCAADDKWDAKAGKPLETAVDWARHYLLDKLTDVSEQLSPLCGTWVVAGKKDARGLVFMADPLYERMQQIWKQA